MFEKEGHLRIRISNYAIENLKHPLAQQLEENRVHYNSYEFFNGTGQWFDTGSPLCNRSSYDECIENYQKCPDKTCHSLIDGVLYICGKVPAIRELHAGAEYPSKNYSKESFPRGLQVNIRKIRKSRLLKLFGLRKIIGRYCIARFLSLANEARPECAFCRINSELYPAAEQLSVSEIKFITRNL